MLLFASEIKKRQFNLLALAIVRSEQVFYTVSAAKDKARTNRREKQWNGYCARQ